MQIDMDDYSSQWQRYRRLTRLGVVAFAVFLGALPLSIFLDHLGFSEGVWKATFLSVAIIGLLSLWVVLVLLTFWRCPRYHPWFSLRSVLGWPSLRRRCVHCGLALYAEDRKAG